MLRAGTGVTVRRVGVVAAVAALLASAAVVWPGAGRAEAATYTVYDLEGFFDALDEIDDAGGNNTISLGADLDFTDVGTIFLDSTIGNLTIEGNGRTVSCDAEAGSCGGWLNLDLGASYTVTLTGLTVTGFTSSSIATFNTNLSISNSTFAGNSALDDSDSSTPIHGGAITDYSNASVEIAITNVTFRDNLAEAGNAYGGAISTQTHTTVTNSNFEDNTASGLAIDAWGGAIAVYGARLDVSGSTFTGNQAFAHASTYGHGGAISGYDASIYIDDSTFDENFATDNGGAVYVAATTYLSVQDSTFSDNEAEEIGGAMFVSESEFDVSRTVFDGNEAHEGGAIETNSGGGSVYQSLFTENSAPYGAGLVATSSSLVDVTSTTFTGNDAGDATIVSASGSGIDLNHVTVAANSASGQDDVAAQILAFEAQLTMHATAVLGGDLFPGGTTPEDNCATYSGIFYSDGYNAIDDDSCGFSGDPTSVESTILDGQLGPLQFNGGPTNTMMPAGDSILVDAVPVGVEVGCDIETEDQRGVLRPQGDACDIGAVEAFEVIEGPVSTPGGTVWVRIYNSTSVDEPGVYGMDELSPAGPAGVSFPYGALGLEIGVWDDGWPVDIEIITPAPTNQLWKLIGGEWVQYPSTTATEGPLTLWTFRLIDGADGDTDGTANSTILDPIAAGIGAAFTG